MRTHPLCPSFEHLNLMSEAVTCKVCAALRSAERVMQEVCAKVADVEDESCEVGIGSARRIAASIRALPLEG